MCEIFPEVSKCCLCIDIKLALLLISVISIMSGVTLLCIMEQRTSTNFDNVQNITNINSPIKILNGLKLIIPTGLSAMAGVFMFTGIVLLLAIVLDQEGLVQVFVWVTFLNVLFGFALVMAVVFECLVTKHCLLQGMDWLSAAALVVAIVGYLFMWIYFVIVGNTYVMNVFF